MKRIFLCATSLCVAAAALATDAYAGGRLEQIDLLPQQTFPGLQDADVVPIVWDERCVSLSYTVDNIPANAGTPQEIPVEVLAAEQQTAFDQWNDIPTSFIEFNITEIRDIGNGPRGFDFINELTWETPPAFGALASSPSTSLVDETTFVPGDDIDGDGDSDVFDPAVEGRNTCFDADGDGDIEFPAGDYAAGTILDNDVQYNDSLGANILWNVGPKSSEGQPFREVDVQAVAVHEFGHSHSLSHTLINQISSTDGTGSTMFPFIDIDDEGSEVGSRSLHTDDIAWSSFVYPEGSSATGPGSLQPGDVPFHWVFRVIRGSVAGPDGAPVAGASVQAVSRFSGRTLSEGFSGTTRLFVGPDGSLNLFTPDTSILNGEYAIPVPIGVYDVRLEAVDGSPVPSTSVSFTAQIGDIFGQQNFAEEFWSFRAFEDSFELFPGFSVPVFAGTRRPVDFVVNTDAALNVGAVSDFLGSGAVGELDNVIYASRFANVDVLGLLESGAELTTGLYHTAHVDASFIPLFEEASIVLGTLSEDGLTADLDLAHKFSRTRDFVGQDNDLTPDYYQNPIGLSRKLERALRNNPGKDVFLVLEVRDGLEGPSGVDPLVSIDAIEGAEVATGNSFLSVDGGPFDVQTERDWIMELRFTGEEPAPAATN